MTATQCAEVLGCSIAAWSQWEKGKRDPGLEQIADICQMFGVSPNELFGIDRDTSAAPQIYQTAVGNNNRLTATVGNAGEMPICRSCPKVTALQETLATIMQAARTAAAKPPRKTR